MERRWPTCTRSKTPLVSTTVRCCWRHWSLRSRSCASVVTSPTWPLPSPEAQAVEQEKPGCTDADKLGYEAASHLTAQVVLDDSRYQIEHQEKEDRYHRAAEIEEIECPTHFNEAHNNHARVDQGLSP